jgi:hypothetical protein
MREEPKRSERYISPRRGVTHASAINTIQAVRRSVVDEMLAPYKHLGEMR